MKLSNLFETTSDIGFFEISRRVSVDDYERILKLSEDYQGVDVSEKSAAGTGTAWIFIRCTDVNQLEDFIQAVVKTTGISFIIEKSYFMLSEKISDFRRIPKEFPGSVWLHGDKCGFDSFKGIEKHITRMNGTFYFDPKVVKSHVLGLVLIPGIEEIMIPAPVKDQKIGSDTDGWDFEQVFNDHIKVKGDIFELQDKLIDMGFEEYAQL